MFFNLHIVEILSLFLYDDDGKLLLDQSESDNEDDDEVGNLFFSLPGHDWKPDVIR